MKPAAVRFAAVGLIGALALALSGCFYAWGGARQVRKPFFEQAMFTISGHSLLLRNDDRQPWRDPTVTLDTDRGFFRQKIADMTPGETRKMALGAFVNDQGVTFGPGIALKTVWVQVHYPGGDLENLIAYPSSVFGGQAPVVPPPQTPAGRPPSGGTPQ